MNAEEYQKVVAELARLHVAEGKPLNKIVAKTVMVIKPMTVLAHSLREPTEEQLYETAQAHNPFAGEDMTDELHNRYNAICKLQLDVEAAVKSYREERHHPITFRLLEVGSNRYLTWMEADPDCDDKDNNKMAEFTGSDTAELMANAYNTVMYSIGLPSRAVVASFNRYHERIS